MTPELEKAARALDEAPEVIVRRNPANTSGTEWEVVIRQDDQPINDNNPKVVSTHSTCDQAEAVAYPLQDELRTIAVLEALSEPSDAMVEGMARAIYEQAPVMGGSTMAHKPHGETYSWQEYREVAPQPMIDQVYREARAAWNAALNHLRGER